MKSKIIAAAGAAAVPVVHALQRPRNCKGKPNKTVGFQTEVIFPFRELEPFETEPKRIDAISNNGAVGNEDSLFRQSDVNSVSKVTTCSVRTFTTARTRASTRDAGSEHESNHQIPGLEDIGLENSEHPDIHDADCPAECPPTRGFPIRIDGNPKCATDVFSGWERVDLNAIQEEIKRVDRQITKITKSKDKFRKHNWPLSEKTVNREKTKKKKQALNKFEEGLKELNVEKKTLRTKFNEVTLVAVFSKSYYLPLINQVSAGVASRSTNSFFEKISGVSDIPSFLRAKHGSSTAPHVLKDNAEFDSFVFPVEIKLMADKVQFCFVAASDICHTMTLNQVLGEHSFNVAIFKPPSGIKHLEMIGKDLWRTESGIFLLYIAHELTLSLAVRGATFQQGQTYTMVKYFCRPVEPDQKVLGIASFVDTELTTEVKNLQIYEMGLWPQVVFTRLQDRDDLQFAADVQSGLMTMIGTLFSVLQDDLWIKWMHMFRILNKKLLMHAFCEFLYPRIVGFFEEEERRKNQRIEKEFRKNQGIAKSKKLTYCQVEELEELRLETNTEFKYNWYGLGSSGEQDQTNKILSPRATIFIDMFWDQTSKTPHVELPTHQMLNILKWENVRLKVERQETSVYLFQSFNDQRISFEHARYATTPANLQDLQTALNGVVDQNTQGKCNKIRRWFRKNVYDRFVSWDSWLQDLCAGEGLHFSDMKYKLRKAFLEWLIQIKRRHQNLKDAVLSWDSVSLHNHYWAKDDDNQKDGDNHWLVQVPHSGQWHYYYVPDSATNLKRLQTKLNRVTDDNTQGGCNKIKGWFRRHFYHSFLSWNDWLQELCGGVGDIKYKWREAFLEWMVDSAQAIQDPTIGLKPEFHYLDPWLKIL